MKNNLLIKKCDSCGAFVEVINDCTCDSDCGISCCGNKMSTLIPNSSGAAFEKHVPIYEVVGDKIKVSVNHGMSDEHYIKFIALVNGSEYVKFDLKNSDEATALFNYIPGSTIYEYCNLHGLWKIDVE